MNNDTMTVAKRLVELCTAGKNLQALDELYNPNIVSIEPHSMPDMPARMEGIEAIRGKNKWWFENHEIHGTTIDGPWPNGDRFIIRMGVDITSKTGPYAGKRMQFEEAALYTVKNGKVVQEEFFAAM